MCRAGYSRISVKRQRANHHASCRPALVGCQLLCCQLPPRVSNSGAVAAVAAVSWLLQDINAIRSSRQKVFQLYEEGKLQAWVDVSHGYTGVEQIPQAIDYMLQGGHIGKVVIPL